MNPFKQHLNPFRKIKRYLIYKLKKKINIDSINYLETSKIDELFKFFDSDKGTRWKKNQEIGHGYSQFYEKHLNVFKNEKINILEIGSFAGASAASFVKYFPSSKVYCLDINLTNFKFFSKNIKVFGLDISNELMINEFYKKINIFPESKFFDIIIDDGSHKLSDILKSLNSFFKNLKSGGIYILEDYKFPNYYSHLNDCSENKIDEVIDFIKNKKVFKSEILSSNTINNLIKQTDHIYQYKGLLENSDISFLKKLN